MVQKNIKKVKKSHIGLAVNRAPNGGFDFLLSAKPCGIKINFYGGHYVTDQHTYGIQELQGI